VKIGSPPPDRHFEIGRASELVVSVQPTPRTPPSESGAERSTRGARPLDMLQREALMEQYASGADNVLSRNVERQAQRALQAYTEVSQSDQREVLADMLGVSEYA
jgi:hypothetical protein